MAERVLPTTTAPVLPAVEAYLAQPPKMLIGGQYVEARSGDTLPVENPATGDVLTTVPAGDADDADLGVRAARAAFEGEWSAVTPSDRSCLLWRLADLVEANADELAQLITLEMGKPFQVARHAELADAVEMLR